MSEVMVDRDPYFHAAASGWDVVLPGDNELFIDIDHPPDSPEADLAVRRVHCVLETLLGNADLGYVLSFTTSPGGNLHVYATLSRMSGECPALPLNPCERIALQAACGSDGVREALSLVRKLKNYEAAGLVITCFFELPGTTRRMFRVA